MKDIDQSIVTLNKQISKIGETDTLIKAYYDFIRKHADYIDWNAVSHYAPFTVIEKLADDFPDDLFWYTIQRRKDLTETLIEMSPDNFNWINICEERKLSEGFMRRNVERLSWRNISIMQDLSESFMEDYFDKIFWKSASKHQKLSMSFIKKHLDKLRLSTVLIHQNISRDQMQEITQTKEFQSQLAEGLLVKDAEWMQFKTYYYTDALYNNIKKMDKGFFM